MEQPAPIQATESRQHRRYRRLLMAVACLPLLLLLFCLGLPVLVEWQVQRLLNRLAESGSWQFSVRRIGLFSSDVRLQVPDPADPAGDPRLAVDTCMLIYRPLPLLRGRIDAVRLSGVHVVVQEKEGRLHLPAGKTLRRRPDTAAADELPPALPPWTVWQNLPVRIGELGASGVVLLRLETERSVLPFRLQLRQTNAPAEPALQLTARADLGGNGIRLQAALNPANGQFSADADLELHAATLPLTWRRHLPPQTSARGRLQANGQWLQAEPLPEQLLVDFPVQLQTGDGRWQISGNPRLKVQLREGRLLVQLHNLTALDRGQDAYVLDLASLEADPADGRLQGSLRATCHDQPAANLVMTGSWQAPGAPTATASLLALLSGQASGELRLHGEPENDRVRLRLDNMTVEIKQPDVTVRRDQAAGGLAAVLQVEAVTLQLDQGRLHGENLTASAEFSTAGVALQGSLEHSIFTGKTPDTLQIQADDFKVQGGAPARDQPLTWQGSVGTLHGQGRDWQAETVGATFMAADATGGLNLHIHGTRLTASASKDVHLQFPGYQLNLEMQPAPAGGPPQFSGLLSLNDGQLQERKAKVAVEDISLQLPFFWPINHAQTDAAGTLRLGRVSLDNKPIGHLQLVCLWTGQGVNGQGEADLLGLRISLQGMLNRDAEGRLQGTAEMLLPSQPLPADLPWAEWLPTWADLQLSGTVEAELHGNWRGDKGTGRLKVQLDQVDAVSAARKAALRGGRLTLELPRLPELATGGSQRLACRELKFGNLELGSGFVQFRVDNARLAYVESLRFNWCDGILRTGSIRLSPESERLIITLYGDRLRLPAMLSQFGLGRAEGEGRISGSLPLVISRDNVRFRDAFLYSTPGETGQLRLQPSEPVSRTAAASDQMQLALEALSDFSFNWVRLTLDTDAENLQLSLKVDGKPNQRLHFRPQGAGFVKSEVANEFQGLALNLNVSVPLQEFLRFYLDWQRVTR